MAEVISALPEEQRLVIALYYYEEFTLAQIGTILEMSEFRTSQLYASGVLSLRARLGEVVGKWEPSVHTSARPPTKNPGC
jgi:RNA polymerase sigma factor for flagellar operon FliA